MRKTLLRISAPFVLAAAAMGAVGTAHAGEDAAGGTGACDPNFEVTDNGVENFDNAFNTWICGGEDVGRGAAELVAGAYTGIGTTPSLLATNGSGIVSGVLGGVLG